MAKKLSYVEAMREIDEILARLGGNEVDVDLLARDVKRATELIALCREKLTGVESEVNNILEE